MSLFYLEDTLDTIIFHLKERSRSISTTESCTGGILATALTERPGSSLFYKGGVTAYTNLVKKTLLGVPENCLLAHGAVSKETASFMAYGIKELTAADYGVSITGIAGPTGSSPQKPVGTVWCAFSYKKTIKAHLLATSGSRSKIRHEASLQTLSLLAQFIAETNER